MHQDRIPRLKSSDLKMTSTCCRGASDRGCQVASSLSAVLTCVDPDCAACKLNVQLRGAADENEFIDLLVKWEKNVDPEFSSRHPGRMFLLAQGTFPQGTPDP